MGDHLYAVTHYAGWDLGLCVRTGRHRRRGSSTGKARGRKTALPEVLGTIGSVPSYSGRPTPSPLCSAGARSLGRRRTSRRPPEGGGAGGGGIVGVAVDSMSESVSTFSATRKEKKKKWRHLLLVQVGSARVDGGPVDIELGRECPSRARHDVGSGDAWRSPWIGPVEPPPETSEGTLPSLINERRPCAPYTRDFLCQER